MPWTWQDGGPTLGPPASAAPQPLGPPASAAPPPPPPPPAPAGGASGSWNPGGQEGAPQPGGGIAAPGPSTGTQFPQLEQIPRYTPGKSGGGGGIGGDLATMTKQAGAGAAATEAEGKDLAQEGQQVGQAYSDLGVYQGERSKARQAIATELSNQYNVRLSQYQDAVKDYANQKVDPNHFWATKGTGSQIGLVIAQALGGFANGFSGGRIPNAAADMIKSRIENDIRAQQSNIDQKGRVLGEQRNLISMARDAGIDKMHEFDVASAAAKEQVANQIDGLQASFGGKAAMDGKAAIAANLRASAAKDVAQVKLSASSNANQAAELHIRQHEAQVADVQARNAQLLAQHQNEIVSHFMGGGEKGTDDVANYERAVNPELGKRLAHLGPGQNVLVPDEKTKSDIEDASSTADQGIARAEEAKELLKRTGSGVGTNYIFAPEDTAKADDLATSMQTAALNANMIGSRLNPESIKLAGAGDVPNVAQLGTTASKLAKLNAYEARLRDIKAAIGSKFGQKTGDTTAGKLSVAGR